MIPTDTLDVHWTFSVDLQASAITALRTTSFWHADAVGADHAINLRG